MFQFFKPKKAPEGPVDFQVEVTVHKPASEVYPLIDWADERNAKVQLGNVVRPVEGSSDRFELVLAQMPEHRFEMTVTEAVANEAYCYSTDIVPPVGRLAQSREDYRIEALGQDQCRLSMVMTATFNPGLTMDEYEDELAMMTYACTKGLAKLKIQAERGVDAVREFEERCEF